MALNSDQKKKLERLSIEREGVAFVGRSAQPTPTPTVVLSLGGLGGETLNVLKGKLVQNVGECDHIFFLAVDTADNDLAKLKKSSDDNGNLRDEETASLYDPAINNILMEGGIHRPQYTYQWMVQNFPQTHLDNKGAQGIRQIGRVMLLCGSAYDTLRARLTAIMGKVQTYQRDNGIYDLEIMLVAGVSGGTGSGTIIDFSYLVRRVVMEDCKMTCSFSAYLYTPDVQFQVPGIQGKANVMNNLMRNGYAAFKEIDYFNNLENFKGVYRVRRAQETYECKSNIFDAVTIVSGFAADGGVNTKAASINNLTESLLDLLTNISISSGGGAIQMAKEFSSNMRANLAAWYNTYARDNKGYPKAANYNYQVIGYSGVSIPKQEILAYCVNEMFQTVYKEFMSIHSVDGDMVNRVLSFANVQDESVLANYALGLVEGEPVNTDFRIPSNQYPKKADVKNRADNMMSLAADLARDEANRINNKMFRQKVRSDIYNKINNQLDQIFGEKGPYYVIELLTHTTGKAMAENDPRKPFAGVDEVLVGIANMLQEKANAAVAKAKSGDVRTELDKRAEKATGFRAGRREMGEYADYCCSVARVGIFNATYYQVLADELNNVIQDLRTVNNDIWEVYTAVLDEVSRILNKNADVVTSSSKHESTYTYQVLNLYEMNDKNQRLKNYLDDFVSPAAVAELSQAFINSMRDKRNRWTEMTKLDQFNVVAEVRAIFEEMIQSTMKTDIIEKFVVAAYHPTQLKPADIDSIWDPSSGRTQEKQAAIDAAARDIYQILIGQGGEMAKLTEAATFDEKHMVITLDDTPLLSAAIQALFGVKAGISLGTSRGLTKYLNSTVRFNVPLYLFSGFKDYDEAYRESFEHGGSLGLHMDEVEQDWKRFPQPYILDVAARNRLNYRRFSDYDTLLKVREQCDKAMQLGFIKLNPAQDKYELSIPEEDTTEISDETFKNIVAEAVDEDPEKELDAAMLETAGVVYKQLELGLNEHALRPTDLDGADNWIQIGDFYKLVRMSANYMDGVDEVLKFYDGYAEKYNTLKTALVKKGQYRRNIKAFADVLRAGVITSSRDNVLTYSADRDGNSEVLIDLRAESRTDRPFILYHAFAAFQDLDGRTQRTMRDQAKDAIRKNSDRADEFTDQYAAQIRDILGGDHLGDLYARDDINEDAKSSSLNYTITDQDEIKKNPYKVLLRFYKLLQKEF